MNAERKTYRKSDRTDWVLGKAQTLNKVTVIGGAGAVSLGLLTVNPLLVGAGLASMGIDGVQMVGVDKVREWRKKKEQNEMMSEQLPREGIIYQRA